MGKLAGLGFACMLGIAALAATGASAQDLVDGKDAEAIAALLKGFGSARVETDSDGDPRIAGRADGKPYKVHFYGCKENKDCTNIQFWAYWEGAVELEKVNEWNRDTRFGKLYVDADGDLVLEYDVNLIGGISERTLEDDGDVWVTLLSRVESGVLGR